MIAFISILYPCRNALAVRLSYD